MNLEHLVCLLFAEGVIASLFGEFNGDNISLDELCEEASLGANLCTNIELIVLKNNFNTSIDM